MKKSASVRPPVVAFLAVDGQEEPTVEKLCGQNLGKA